MAALNDCGEVDYGCRYCCADAWQTHVMRETGMVEVLYPRKPGHSSAMLEETAIYRICGRCGYTERRTWSTGWKPWVKAKEDPDE
jgi:hypothetical protein